MQAKRIVASLYFYPGQTLAETYRHCSHNPINRWISGKLLPSLSGKLLQLSLDRSELISPT
jgi:hypothetical protein